MSKDFKIGKFYIWKTPQYSKLKEIIILTEINDKEYVGEIIFNNFGDIHKYTRFDKGSDYALECKELEYKEVVMECLLN